MMLGMVFMIEGQREYGLAFIERLQRSMSLEQGHAWDLPCIIKGDTGERNSGTDYYQNMMFWAVPATVLGTDIAGLCAPNGFVDVILRAGAAQSARGVNTSTGGSFSIPPGTSA
jgi:hypothetical protein